MWSRHSGSWRRWSLRGPRSVLRRASPRRPPATDRRSDRARGSGATDHPSRSLRSRQVHAVLRPPAGSSRPWIARASPPSVRLRTIRARSTRLIWPFSSETTTTTASVCSVIPRAARWRVPNRSVWMDVSASGSKAPGRDDPVLADDHSPVVERGPGHEDRAQEVGRHIAVDHDAGLGHLLETRLSLEDDQGAMAVGRQPGRRPGDLRRDVDCRAGLGGREQPTKGPHTADAFERPPQLRLEDDHECEQADDGARLEDLGQQPEIERDRQGIDDDEHADADHQSDCPRPADQAEQPIDEERGDPDVDDRRQADLVEDRAEELGHPSASVASRSATAGSPRAPMVTGPWRRWSGLRGPPHSPFLVAPAPLVRRRRPPAAARRGTAQRQARTVASGSSRRW